MATNVPVTSSCGTGSFGTPSFGGNYGAVTPFGYGAPFTGFGGNNWMNPWTGSDNRSNWMNPWTGFDNRSNWMTPFGGFGGFGNFGNFGGFNGLERFANRAFRDLEKTFSSELNLQPSRPASMLEHYSLTNPIRYDAEGNRWFNCYFDLRSYKPEEVSVTLDSKNRFLNVEASHEVKDKEHYIKRHYSRKVYIPEDLKIDLSKLDIKSSLTNEGLLCVESALPKLSLEEARTCGTTGAGKSIANYEPNVYKVATKTI